MKNLLSTSLVHTKVFFSYLKYVALAFLILYVGLLIFPVISFHVFMEASGRVVSSAVLKDVFVDPAVIGRMWFIAFLFVVTWPLIAFIVWIVRDSKKFKVQGVQTRPYLWGIGMIPPLIFVVFPLYLIKRNIIWPKKLDDGVLGGILENTKIVEKVKEKRRWARVGVLILLVLFVAIPIFFSLLIQAGMKNRTLGNFLVNYSLITSCSLGKSGCDELRPLPKILQNKKIVFNKSTSIQFDPRYRPEIGLTDLDILGSLNTNRLNVALRDIIDPSLEKLGYLSERGYKIVRAVYHHNCSYCVDSSDYAYVVLEDSKGNRFSSLLNELDFSVVPGRHVPWDERVPYDLGRDGEFGKLIDIKSALAQ